jgi:hypothetical protein
MRTCASSCVFSRRVHSERSRGSMMQLRNVFQRFCRSQQNGPSSRDRKCGTFASPLGLLGQIFIIAVANIWLTSCASHKYQVARIAPEQTANRVQTRSLSDPGLRDFEQSRLGRVQPWPPQSWTPTQLMLAALYSSPDLDVARSEIQAARAGVVPAGAQIPL